MRLQIVACLLGAALLAGCSSSDSSASNTASSNAAGEKPYVAFAQANSQDPWRQMFNADINAAANEHSSEFTFDSSDAKDDAGTQIGNIETALVKHPKVLLVSPANDAVQPAIEKAHDAGVFVILLDRSVPGDKWDAYVGGDNKEIGRQAGEYMAKRLNGKGTVLMIQGIADAAPTRDRRDGFMESISKYPGITVMKGDDCGYQREKATTYMESFLQAKKPFDAVYAHNDEMAIGAYMAMEAANTPKKIIVGIDGCQKEVVDMIKEGKIDATFSYPQPGPKGIELAADFLKGSKPDQKQYLLPTEMVTKENADDYLTKHPNIFEKK